MRCKPIIVMFAFLVVLSMAMAQPPPEGPKPPLEVGEVVRLKVGENVEMVVVEIVARNPQARVFVVKCLWLDKERRVQTVVIPESCLLRARPPESEELPK